MNVAEALDQVRKGTKIGVVVTNLVTGEQTVHELTESQWMRRLAMVPLNTNHVVLELEEIENEH